jgi:hypothetical protein
MCLFPILLIIIGHHQLDLLCNILNSWMSGWNQGYYRRSRTLVDQFHMCPQSAHHRGPFRRVTPRHDGVESRSASGAHDGETGAGVAGRELHHAVLRDHEVDVEIEAARPGGVMG